MTGAAVADDLTSVEDRLWWYRAGEATPGPVSSSELRRLAADGALGPETLVWRKAFGEHWKPLDAAIEYSPHRGRPPVDYGPWTRSFTLSAAEPRTPQRSWLGLLGPVGYLWLGMWRRALIILSADFVLSLMFAFIDVATDAPFNDYAVPDIAMVVYCVWNLKRDYYRFRVLGERVWPRMSALDNGFACGGVALVLFVTAGLAQLSNPFDALTTDVAGVWQGEAAKVVIDVAGTSKHITYDGSVHSVAVRSADDRNGVIVFADIHDPSTLFTIQKHWTDDHTSYSLDLLVDDRLVDNLTYVRPI